MDLDLVAEHLGVEVLHGCPIVGHWAEYDANAHQITIRPDLGPAQYTSAYSHELAHAYYRHESSTTRTEREACHLAHWLTIGLCDFLRAAMCQETPEGVASELGVMPSDVRAYARRFGGHHAN